MLLRTITRYTKPEEQCGLLERAAKRVALLIVLSSCMIGCHSANHTATSLPTRFAAAQNHDLRSLDLGRLASADLGSETIYPGDTLTLLMVTGAEERVPQPWTLTVSEDGRLDVPLVGSVQVAGQSLANAESLVQRTSIDRGIFRSPSVSIAFSERRQHRVTITGAVENPGVVELPASSSDLLGAIVAAGGLSDSADRIVEIKRSNSLGPTRMATSAGGVQPAAYESTAMDPSPNSLEVDLVDAASKPATGGYRVADGDVIVVREKPTRYVHVLGLVNDPNQFEVPAYQNVTLLNAISMAGGLTTTLADRVVIIRKLSDSEEPITISASIRQAKSEPSANILLADGDVVSVEETPVTFVSTALTSILRVGVSGFTL